MHYELYMGAALAEATEAAAAGDRADGAVAVMGEAMVATGRDQTSTSSDPTAHAVMIAVREAARKLRSPSLSGLTVFSVVEPCAMCVGALLQSDADGVVFALPDPVDGACGTAIQLAQSDDGSRSLRIVSGILQADAADLHPGFPVARTTNARGVIIGR